MKKVLVALFLLMFGTTLSVRVSADTPVVNSFKVNSSVESGQAANFDWTITGGGHSLIIFCAQGIKLRYATTNATFPCDTRVSVSASASDSVSIIIANVSGSPRIVTARIIPKNANGGTDYDAGAKEATIYVNPSRQPFDIFYTTATSTISGVATTFYWSSTYLDGVNLRIACDDAITATSTTYGQGPIPCNQMIFPSDLPGTGSVTFKFSNQSTVELPLGITLFPAMSPRIYDGTHAQTITLTVASDAQKPLSVKFNASRHKIFSGDSILFDWSVVNGIGANIKFSCSPMLQLRAFSVSTTTTLACGDYAWPVPFLAVASTSVTFLNLNETDETATVTLFPALKNGNYDGNSAQILRINVEPISKTLVPQAPATVQAPVQAVSQAVSSTSAKPAMVGTTSPVKNVFTKWQSSGSRSPEVALLQRFLAKDKSWYPEGLASGYFGAATKRAVGRFQIKFGLIKNSKDPAYGVLDAKTRFSLNALQ